MNYELARIIFALTVAIGLIIALNRLLKVHVFFSLLVAALSAGLMLGKPFINTLAVMQDGFGTMLQQIGFVVILGSCLGNLLEKTGCMSVISQRIMRWFGTKRAVAAMTSTGVLVGIPVFCDSGFIILSKLIPSLAAQSGSVNSAQLALALSTGLYSSHTLVPPTPGPLAAAGNFGMNEIGTLILTGLAVSIPVAIVSNMASKHFGKSLATTYAPAERPHSNISPFKAFLPLLLPLILIAGGMVTRMMDLPQILTTMLSAMGHPVVALALGLLCILPLVDSTRRGSWHQWISESLKDAGLILLITGAGGSFGAVIKNSGMEELLKEYAANFSLHGTVFLMVAFLLAALLKTAQGSTTSSMIITSSLLVPLLSSAGFITSFHLSLLTIVIGGGAMVVSHTNDSYFWVVSQFGGMRPGEMFRSFTLITLLQGTTVLTVSIVLFLLFA